MLCCALCAAMCWVLTRQGRQNVHIVWVPAISNLLVCRTIPVNSRCTSVKARKRPLSSKVFLCALCVCVCVCWRALTPRRSRALLFSVLRARALLRIISSGTHLAAHHLPSGALVHHTHHCFSDSLDTNSLPHTTSLDPYLERTILLRVSIPPTPHPSPPVRSPRPVRTRKYLDYTSDIPYLKIR